METRLKFERPIGARADLAELKYVSALHQTSDLRPDGSLRRADVAYLLRSKFGVALADDEVEDIILRGLSTGAQLGGGSGDDGAGGGTFDLAEVAAALVIPELLRVARGENGEDAGDDPAPPGDVLEVVLESITKKVSGSDIQPDLCITRETVKRVLASLGEVELADNNDLIDRMVLAASGDPEAGPAPLNTQSLARALTSDLHAYKVGEGETYAEHLLGKEDPKALLCCKRRNQVASGEAESPGKNEVLGDSAGEEGAKEEGTSIIVTAVSANNATQEDEEEGSQPGKVSVTSGSDDEEGQEGDKAGDASIDGKDEPKEDEANNTGGHQVKRIITTRSIDYAIDAQTSRCIAVTLWLFFLLHILASGSLGLQDFPSLVPNDLAMCPDTANLGCDILEVFLGWVDSVFTLTIVGGIFIMSIGSLGNSADRKSRILVLTSTVPVLYFFIKPFTSIGTAPYELSGYPQRQFALGLSMAVAIVIVCERIRQYVHLFVVPRHWFDSYPRLVKAFARGFTGSEHERLSAARCKINRALRNACDISREGKNDEQRKHILFHEKDEAMEKVGGHRWVWQKMRDKSLYCEEGVRFSARLVAANLMQFAIIVYIILYMLQLVGRLVENHENSFVLVFIRSSEDAATALVSQLQDLSGIAKKFLDVTFAKIFPALESLRVDSCKALLSSSNPNANTTLHNSTVGLCSSNSTFLTDLEQQSGAFMDLVLASMVEKAEPARAFLENTISAGADILADVSTVVDPVEAWHIQLAFGIGGLVAFFASIFLATLYLPSVASTTLKFRSGLLPSLADPKRFTRMYRGGQHYVTYLTGAIFWGTLLYVTLLAGIIAVFILVLVWLSAVDVGLEMPPPGPWGWLLGTIVAFTVQYLIFNFTTCGMYEGFYRRRPGRANVHNLLWEAAWVGLSVLSVVMRGIKLALVAALQIGRIDVPFLANGVGEYWGANMDFFPHCFQKDILAHEAHNHPYIERLSRIYLLKVAHPEFANEAGTAWRLIFVLALFPWLRKYRTDARFAQITKEGRSVD